MSMATTDRRTRPAEVVDAPRAPITLDEEHAALLRGVRRRADAVIALLAARTWPHSELATLTGFLRTVLLRQVSDEESLLFPHDATAAPFAELSAAHVRIYELTEALDHAYEHPCPMAQLRRLVEELLTTLRRHLAEERELLMTLAATDLEVPAAATVSQTHRHWPAVPDDGPVVINLETLPTALASQLCLERVLRLHPGEQAVIHSRDRLQLNDVRSWLHEFDAVRFTMTTTSEPHGEMSLDVAVRDPR